MGSETNGVFAELKSIDRKVDELKDDLAKSIDKLTMAVEGLSGSFDRFIHVAETSIPIKVVFWLLIMMILGLVGIEGVKALPRILM